MRRYILLIILCVFCTVKLRSQNNTATSGFRAYYPIHQKPSVGYLSSMNNFETILFDAKPVVYYSFANNIGKRLQDSTYTNAHALYTVFEPQIRLYNEESLPVKTPSYRIALGYQFLKKTTETDFYAISFETGHFSNGQSGCAFANGLTDETAECIAAHALITDDSDLSLLLNRDNGNFSTNWSKLSFNYRFNVFRTNNKPRVAHSFIVGWEYYHNNLLGFFDIGGFSDFDLSVFGRSRLRMGYEFIHTFSGSIRYSAEVNMEYITNPHPFIDPFRAEVRGIFYPGNLDFGIYVNFVTGHDNYNYRLVDSGTQAGIGIIWDWFPPLDRPGAR